MYASDLLEAGMESNWAHERRFQQHLKKLKQIRKQPLSQPIPSSSPRTRGISFFEAERLESIKRENALLMRKLMSIAEGKVTRGNRKSLEPRSLNEYLRKKESDRIRMENEAFSRRLQEKEGFISKKKLDLSFFESQKYKRQISKTYILRSQVQGRNMVKPNPLTDSDSTGDLRTKRSPKAYQRTTDLSPLNMTLPVMEDGKGRNRMETKGELAVISGKKGENKGKMQGKTLQMSVLNQKKNQEKGQSEGNGSEKMPVLEKTEKEAPHQTPDKVVSQTEPVEIAEKNTSKEVKSVELKDEKPIPEPQKPETPPSKPVPEVSIPISPQPVPETAVINEENKANESHEIPAKPENEPELMEEVGEGRPEKEGEVEGQLPQDKPASDENPPEVIDPAPES